MEIRPIFVDGSQWKQKWDKIIPDIMETGMSKCPTSNVIVEIYQRKPDQAVYSLNYNKVRFLMVISVFGLS